MVILVVLRLFLILHALVISKNKLFVYKNTLQKYGGKNAEKVLRGNCVFNYTAFIKTTCIANSIVSHVLVMDSIIPIRERLETKY